MLSRGSTKTGFSLLAPLGGRYGSEPGFIWIMLAVRRDWVSYYFRRTLRKGKKFEIALRRSIQSLRGLIGSRLGA